MRLVNPRKVDVIIAGIGGQGVLLAGEIVAEMFMKTGFDVKKYEVRGISQRTGSVVCYIRAATKVFSPVISEGSADFLVGLELIDTYRYRKFLKKDGNIIVVDRIIPFYLIGDSSIIHPNNLLTRLRREFRRVTVVNYDRIDQYFRFVNAVNMVILGVFSNYLNLDEQSWQEVIKKKVPHKTVDMNLKAFKSGRRMILK
jgi:indolepyruvate ferredoxin oxidoreductase beta subunit